MPNKLTRKSEDEGETFHSRALDSIPEEGGRFAKAPPQVMGAGGKYPAQTNPNYWSAPQPDHGFSPSRDRIPSADVTSMTFGLALSGKSFAPEVSSLPQAPGGGEAPTTPAASPPSFPRRSL
jgi:hypothetical protein